MTIWAAVAPNPASFGARTWFALIVAGAIVVAGLIITWIAARHRRK